MLSAALRLSTLALLLLVSRGLAQPAADDLPVADAQPPADAQPLNIGRTVRISLPLVGNDDRLHQAILQRAIDKLTADPNATRDRRPLLVLELAPREGDGRGSEFTRCFKLAQFLNSAELKSVRTVAYVPRTVRGHAVLVAMACEEIAVAPEAELGEAGIDEDAAQPLEGTILEAYLQIAGSRKTVPDAIARGWVDRTQEILKVETEESIELVTRGEVEELRKNRTVVNEETLSPAGALASFTGREGRELGFVKYLAADKDALARALRLPRSAVDEDLSLAAEWKPIVIDIAGPITPATVRRTKTMIGDELKRTGANWIALRITSTGGELRDCLNLAETIAELNSAEVRTVAYVPSEASGGAAILALACDQLVLHPQAKLGGGVAEVADNEPPGVRIRLNEPRRERQADNRDAAVEAVRRSLAERAEQPWSLLAALVDERIELARYTNKQTGAARIMSAEELRELENRGDWREGETIKPAGEPLKLSSERWQELGVAGQVVQSFDELSTLYGFAQPPREVRPNWGLELVEALAHPAFRIFLLMMAMAGVYIELHTPGLGAGGFVAVVAFLLFFWSSFLNGTADWLEVLLFVFGLLFVLLEIFVVPGVGIFGVGGACMVLASLVLASQTFIIPKTEGQLTELRNSMGVVVASVLACLVVALVLRRYLPQSAIFQRAMLAPPAPEELAELAHREALVDYGYLLGQAGVAVTNLFPAGRAEFDGELVDVISEAGAIDRGDRVVVTSAKANRVLVRRA
jgi:membrane-bound serine protease (ClpP class)